MTASEMLDSLNAVYTQIRADQKEEEYDDILAQIPKPEKPTGQISDAEALNIILGGADA